MRREETKKINTKKGEKIIKARKKYDKNERLNSQIYLYYSFIS